MAPGTSCGHCRRGELARFNFYISLLSILFRNDCSQKLKCLFFFYKYLPSHPINRTFHILLFLQIYIQSIQWFYLRKKYINKNKNDKKIIVHLFVWKNIIGDGKQLKFTEGSLVLLPLHKMSTAIRTLNFIFLFFLHSFLFLLFYICISFFFFFSLLCFIVFFVVFIFSASSFFFTIFDTIHDNRVKKKIV